MQPKSIEKVSPATVSPSTIGARLPELRSIAYKLSLQGCSPFERGLIAEKRVIEFFQGRSYKLIKQRYRTPFAEVDLIFQKDRETFLMLEVKSITSFDFLPNRIGYKQKNRLFRAHQYLLTKTSKKIELNWAFVTEDGEVLVIDDVCG